MKHRNKKVGFESHDHSPGHSKKGGHRHKPRGYHSQKSAPVNILQKSLVPSDNIDPYATL